MSIDIGNLKEHLSKDVTLMVNEKSYDAIYKELGYHPPNLLTNGFINDGEFLVLHNSQLVKPIPIIKDL